jgi:tripartite-type tricarboxylate transporter receptor subunit TctC
MKLARVLPFALAALCALLGSLPAGAQAPGRPLSLIVGTPPAGAVDAYARTVAEHMARTLGQQVLVENKPGANGNISAELVQRAPADGHTVWVGTQSMVEINPSAFGALRWQPDEFVALLKGVEAPLVLVAHPSLGARSLAELITWAKANPDRAAYASFSPGTSSHFIGYQLAERLGVKMTHVPYKGSAPQTQDLLGGHVPLGFSQLQTTVPHIEQGKLVALATTGKARWRQLPQVPTLAELGHPDLSATVWFGLLVRRETPADAQRRILDAALRAHADPAVRTRLENMGFDIPAQTDPALSAEIRSARARWEKVVRATGFKAAD